MSYRSDRVDGRLPRRQMVRSLMSASLLVPAALSELLARDAPDLGDPLAPRPPHYPGTAKRVIFLFMTGGVSHLESFDPKPDAPQMNV